MHESGSRRKENANEAGENEAGGSSGTSSPLWELSELSNLALGESDATNDEGKSDNTNDETNNEENIPNLFDKLPDEMLDHVLAYACEDVPEFLKFGSLSTRWLTCTRHPWVETNLELPLYIFDNISSEAMLTSTFHRIGVTLPGLRTIDLYAPATEGPCPCLSLTNEALRVLCSTFPTLKTLDLHAAHNVTDWSPLRMLIALSTLGAGATSFDDDALRCVQLSGSPLAELNLGCCTGFTDTGLTALSAATTLEMLCLSSTATGDEGLRILGGMANLVELDLGYTAVTDAGLSYITGLTSLVSLNLYGCKIGREGLISLGCLVGLEELELSNTNATGEDIAHLEAMTSLKNLTIWRTKVGDEGVRHLLKLQALANLDVQYTQISGKGAEILMAGLPNLTEFNYGG